MDRELVVRARRGDADAFELIVRARLDACYGVTGRSVVPARQLDADSVTTWVLSSLQDMNRHYVLTAAIRGPDNAGLQAQLDALLASVSFDPPR